MARVLTTFDIPNSNITSISFNESKKPNINFAVNFKKTAKILEYNTKDHSASNHELITQHNFNVDIVGYHPYLPYLGTSDNTESKLWDLSANLHTTRSKTTIRESKFLAFYPDSEELIMVTKAKSNNDIHFSEFKGETSIPNVVLSIRHQNEVNCIAFYLFKGTNRFILATGSQDNKIRLWECDSSNWEFTLIQELSGHLGYVNSVAFYQNPIEPILASGSEDGKTKIWRKLPNSTWKCVTTLDDTGNGKSLAFHPKKMFLATGSSDNKNIKIWQFDTTTSNRTKTTLNQVISQDGEITSFNFHPKEAILAIAFDAKIMLVSLREIKFIEYNNSNRNESENESGNGSRSGNESGNESVSRSGSGYESNSHGRPILNNSDYNDFPGGGLQNDSRFFKLVRINGKEFDGGRYELPSKTKSGKAQTRGPKDKASIAFSEICHKNNKKGECSYKFAIQETTRGSNKKVYHYQGKRVKLVKPIVLELKDKKTGEVKKVVKKYKNVIIATH
jgi:WD40 repeat protein